MKKTKTAIRLLQISDCHVAADATADYRGQNADRNLRSLLPEIRSWGPELLLVSGDLAEDGSDAAYARIVVMLGTLGAPVLALPGNHDEPSVMPRHFPAGPWQGPYGREVGSWLIVLLDSTGPGLISGRFSQQYLEQFDDLLRGSTAEHVLVALHHQPLPVGAPWIDRYGLEEPERFLNYIDREPRIRAVVWGHVHHAVHLERKGMAMLGAPSTVANSLPRRQKFTLDLSGPACRWLELGEDGSLETGILRPAQSS
jgi:Icc protein